MNLKKIKYLTLCVGLLILAYIIWNIDYKAVDWSLLLASKTNLLIFIVLLIIIFLIFVIRTIRWMLLLRKFKKLTFWQAYALVTPAISLALFSPAQSGDLIKIEFLKRKFGIERKQALSTVIMEKIMDLLLIGIIFLIAASHISISFLKINMLLIFLICTGIIAMGLILVFAFRNKIKLIKITLENMRLMLKDVSAFISSLFLTAVYWAFLALAWFLVAKTIGIVVSYIFMIELLSIVTLISILTLIPGGIGIIEISTIFILSNLLGILPDIAAVFAILMRLYSVLMAILGYIPFLFRKYWK